jgi:hypothetical protein
MPTCSRTHSRRNSAARELKLGAAGRLKLRLQRSKPIVEALRNCLTQPEPVTGECRRRVEPRRMVVLGELMQGAAAVDQLAEVCR